VTADRREVASARLRARRNFANQVVAYLGVNVALLVVWLLGGGGFYWPVFVMLGWGAALAAQAWSRFGATPITEGDVEREVDEDTRHVA